MSAREWLASQLKGLTDPEAEALYGNRVFAKKSMSSSVEPHPYLVFKLGNATNENMGEEEDVYRQFAQVFIHDFTDEQVGDYTKIDDIVRYLKRKLKNQTSPEHGVIAVEYLETSQDLNDETLSTVMKYVRFQLIVKE